MYFFSLYRQSKILVVLLCFFSYLSFSQTFTNLVNNPSFEDFHSCPAGISEIYKAKNWYRIDYISSPDYLNTCSTATESGVPNNFVGIQNPKSGTAYASIYTYFSQLSAGVENIATSLTTSLQPSKAYCITFHVSLAEKSRVAISNLGVYLGSDSIKSFPPFPPPPNFFTVTPSFENLNTNILNDTINWTRIQGTYFALGGEKSIGVGNFRTYLNTNTVSIKPLTGNTSDDVAYYYIDDISVIEINPAKAATQKTITVCANANTTFTLGTDSTEDATYNWFPAMGLSCTNCPNPVVSPTASIKYFLSKQQCSSLTQDSVYLELYTPTVNAIAGSSKTLCLNEFTQLGINDSTQFTTYLWQPASYLTCSNCATPITTPLSTVTYTLQKTECNISSTSIVEIKVQDCETTYTVPNIFTPNNDGVNETWGIGFNQVRDIKDFSLYIYNRWGVPILQTNLPKLRWDGYTTSGIPCPDAVYFFVCTFKVKEEQKTLKGNITLIR